MSCLLLLIKGFYYLYKAEFHENIRKEETIPANIQPSSTTKLGRIEKDFLCEERKTFLAQIKRVLFEQARWTPRAKKTQ